MKTYGVSRATVASPQIVWRIWSDPNNWSTWNSGIQSAKIDGPLVDDAKGEMTTARGTNHVTFHNVEQGRRFSLSTGGPPLTTLTFSCEITPTGTGSTISQSVGFSGPLAFLFGAMLGPQMAKHFVPVLDDLARTAESQPA